MDADASGVTGGANYFAYFEDADANNNRISHPINGMTYGAATTTNIGASQPSDTEVTFSHTVKTTAIDMTLTGFVVFDMVLVKSDISGITGCSVSLEAGGTHGNLFSSITPPLSGASCIYTHDSPSTGYTTLRGDIGNILTNTTSGYTFALDDIINIKFTMTGVSYNTI